MLSYLRKGSVILLHEIDDSSLALYLSQVFHIFLENTSVLFTIDNHPLDDLRCTPTKDMSPDIKYYSMSITL